MHPTLTSRARRASGARAFANVARDGTTAHSRVHETQDPCPLIRVGAPPDGASRESEGWSGWRFAHVDRCAPAAASGSWPASVGCLASGRPGGRRRHRAVRPSASTERSFRARRGSRGRRSRAWCRGSTPAAAPSSSRRTARSRTGARSGSAWSSFLRSRGDPKGRGRVSRGRAGRRRHRAGARRGLAVESAEHVSRLPARRPARHGRIEAARRRRDPVRDAHGDGRPGRGAGGAGLPAARRIRRFLRGNGGAGLPEAPSLAGAHAHPLRCVRARRPLLRPLRRQRPARPRPARATLRLGARLPEGVPGLGAPVRRAREGMERPPGARHERATSLPPSCTGCCAT